MNKKIVVIMAIFVGIAILFTSLFIKNNKREAITITSYASVVEMSLNDLIERADLIVIGDFINIHPSRWSTANGKLPDDATIESVSQQHLSIFTDSNFQVTQYLKGDAQSPVIRIRTFGGQVGEDSMIVSGEPTYEVGQAYLLFLYYNTGASANIDPGSYYGSSTLYEISDGKAISVKDEWVLEELIAYIQNALAQPIPTEPAVTEIPTETPISTETLISTETVNPTP